MGRAVLGVGAYLPEERVTNQQLVDRGLDTNHDWIVQHTGFEVRHIARPDEATSDLATAAARAALTAAGVDAKDIGYICCATSSPDHLLPATANLVQHNLGCDCGAIDINGGCSGFVHAMGLGFAMLTQSPAKPVLVIGADTYSRLVDWSDRKTAIFFGDGAGAAVLGLRTGPESLLGMVSGSDGGGGDLISIRAGGTRQRTAGERSEAFLKMVGSEVWRFALRHVPALVRAVLEQANLSLDDVDLIVPHQANARMLAMIARELEVPEEKVFINVKDNCNTAAASVGIALQQAASSGRLKEGDIVVLAGFGAGLGWCGMCLRWSVSNPVISLGEVGEARRFVSTS
jgi:3-oxoacyl-[acyl-carrier-protein] synthase-3